MANDQADQSRHQPVDADFTLGTIDRRYECVAPIPGGYLVFPASPAPCDYVRITNEDGAEAVYWDVVEWTEDPKTVMGALMACMLHGPDIMKEE